MSNEVVVIGAGYQGLITACLLARSGIAVQVVPIPRDGDYEEFAAGFKTGPCAHSPVTLPYEIAEDLALKSHGLDPAILKPAFFCPYGTDPGIYEVMDNPFHNLPFHSALAQLETTLQQLEYARPPYREKAWRDTWGTFELGRLLADSDEATQQIFADSAGLSLAGLLERIDISQHQKAAVEMLSLMGAKTDPQARGSAAALIPAYAPFNATRESHVLSGGMHNLLKALKQAAMSYGVTFTEGQNLTGLAINSNKIESVDLDGGEKLAADYFVVDCDPVLFFNAFADKDSLPPAFKTRIAPDQFIRETVHIKMALSGLPRFSCIGDDDDPQALLAGQILIAPDPFYIYRARTDMKQDGGAQLPVISMIIPSLTHSSLAPEGMYSASIMAQYFAADLPDDTETREAMILACIQAVEALAPGFGESIRHSEVMPPRRLAETHSQFGQPSFSGAMPLLQLFKTYFGHHAIGYDLPYANLVMAGYGSGASARPHILDGGEMAAKLLQSILKSDKE